MLEEHTAENAYRLERPTEYAAFQRLTELLGPDQAATAWNTMCHSIGVPPQTELSTEQLRQVARSLSAQHSVLAVIGTSLMIWLRCYEFASSTTPAKESA